MRKYDEVQALLKELRDDKGTSGSQHEREAMILTEKIRHAAADEIEALTALLERQQVIIRRIYAEHLPDTWFVCGERGEKDQNGLPQYIDVCPAYGVGWYQVYEKTDRSVSTVKTYKVSTDKTYKVSTEGS